MFADHGGCVWLALVLFVGLRFAEWGVSKAFVRRKIPTKFSDWLPEVESACVDVVRTDLYAADAKRRLVELVGEIPKDFDPTIWLTCRLGEGVQRTALIAAEREGIAPAGTYERVFGVRATSDAPTSAAPPDTTDLPNVVWLDGRLQPRNASNS